jgi:hypothetical protein
MLSRCLRSGALALALLSPIAAGAQASLVIIGGASAPVSTLGDITDIGYNVAVGVNLGAPALPVGLRLEGGYNGFGNKSFGGTTRIVTGTANALFSVGPGNDAPYLIGGVGVYNSSFSTSSSGYGNSSTALGINGGGGLRFPLSGFNTFFEARYHVMLGNARDGTNYQFIPITFGITF